MSSTGRYEPFCLAAINYPALQIEINDLGEFVGFHWSKHGGEIPPSKERHEIAEREKALYFDTHGALDLAKWLIIHEERLAVYEAAKKEENRLHAALQEELGDYPESMVCNIEFGHFPDKMRACFGVKITKSTNRNILMRLDAIKAIEAWDRGQGVSIDGGPFLTKEVGNWGNKVKGHDCPPCLIEALERYEREKQMYAQNTFEEDVTTPAYILFSAAVHCVGIAPAKTVEQLAQKYDIHHTNWIDDLEKHSVYGFNAIQRDFKHLVVEPVDLDARTEEIIFLAQCSGIPMDWLVPYLKGKSESMASELFASIHTYLDKIPPTSETGKKIAKVRKEWAA